MDADTKKAIENIKNQYQFSEDEKKLVDYSDTATIHSMNHSVVISTLILAKQINISGSKAVASNESLVNQISSSTQELVESNQKLVKSNEKHANKMSSLTIALIVVGAIQAFGIIVQAYAMFIHK